MAIQGHRKRGLGGPFTFRVHDSLEPLASVLFTAQIRCLRGGGLGEKLPAGGEDGLT